VIAKSFARIHRRNLISQGIVALTFKDESDYDKAEVGQKWSLPKLREELEQGSETFTAKIDDDEEITLTHDFSDSEREILLAGGLLAYLRNQDENGDADHGGGRAEQQDAGERAESEDGAASDGARREAGQGVGGHHE
jgi:3-isopropylmalate dehydratase small subunit